MEYMMVTLKDIGYMSNACAKPSEIRNYLYIW